MKKIIQSSVDAAFNIIRFFEEIVKSAKVIKGIRRSIQLDKFSCGAYCAYMILRYYDRDISVEQIKRKLKTTEYGTTEKALNQLFREKGLKVRIKWNASRVDIKKAVEGGYPILISMYEGEHWSIIYGYSREGVFVLDPPLSHFLHEWNWKKFVKVWDDRWIAVIKDS